MTTKPRIFRQCLEVFQDYKSANRSKELVLMSRTFDAYKKDLRALIEALQDQLDAASKMNKARVKVARCLSSLCDRSPIAELVGTSQQGVAQDEQSTAVESSMMRKGKSASKSNKSLSGADSNPSSYLSVHRKIHSQRKLYLDFLDEFIIEYLRKIEKVEVDRVQIALQQSEILRREVDHYFYKVTGLEKQYNRSKAPSKNLADCLKRNKNKWKDAKKAYDDHTQDLCLLLEEITERKWRDLFPVILKLTQSDLFNTTFELDSMSPLHDIVDKLKMTGEKYQVKMDSRVRELKLSTAAELSTRPLEILGSEIPVHVSAAHVADDDISLQPSQVESVADTIPSSFMDEKKKMAGVDDKSVHLSGEKYDFDTDWGDESFVQAAVEAQKRAELYYEALQSNKQSEGHDSQEPDIIVSPSMIAGEKVPKSISEESDFVDVDIHLAPAPTEAD